MWGSFYKTLVRVLKKATILIMPVIVVVAILATTTYALFFKQDKLENKEEYTAGILDIELTNDEDDLGEVLTLDNSIPMTDEDGKKTLAYKFKLTNKGNLTYTFDLKLVSTTIDNVINTSYIKVMVNNNEPVLLSNLENDIIISDMKLDPNQNRIISIRIWLDENIPNTEMGKSFSAKIVSDGIANEINEDELNLDISVASIDINQASDENLLLVSGGGLIEDVKIKPTTSIKITGSTTTNTITVTSADANITLDNVSIIEPTNGTLKLFDNSNVTLTIVGENTLDAGDVSGAFSMYTGLFVNYTSTLTINGDGVLNAIGSAGGIGGTSHLAAGTIIINSGIINARSTYTGAGIGGDDLVKIEINGGNITAIGGPGYDSFGFYNHGGAGIGGSYLASITGEIIINGGVVYAKGQGSAAGIGGGGCCCVGEEYYGFGPNTASNITISSDATVTAIGGGVDAEDIGSGGICDC